MQNRLLQIACIMLMLLASASLSAASQQNPREPLPPIKTIDGRVLDAKAMQGKLIVIDFWATWCMPCHQQLPQLKKIHEKYKDDARVIFIGLAEENASDRVRSYVKKHDVPWSVAMDEEWRIAKRYNVKALPHLLVLDDKQQLAWEGSLDELEKAIRDALKARD